ncbi:MAG: PAS domain-containing protein [Candidatus Magnetoovum sp. WYHC-5]|nr:PAS domain-containing protein [Candidatus Magnetoovum sp. WYHC-5]
MSNEVTIQSDILGRLLVIQETLDVMPDNRGIAEYLSSALSGVPGIDKVYICINNQLLADNKIIEINCNDKCWNKEDSYICKETVGTGHIIIKNKKGKIGCFVIFVKDIKLYKLYEPFLKNVANVVAKEIENREYMNALEVSNIAIKKNREKLLEAQQIAHIGNWEYDIVNDVITWSDELYRIYDIAPGTRLTYALLMERIHPDDRAYHDENTLFWIKYKRCIPYEYRIVKRNGEIRYMYAVGKIEQNEAGEPIKMFGIVQDLTELKTIQESLIDSRQRLSATLSVVGVGTWRWIVDENKNTIDENLNRLLGLQPIETTEPIEEFIGRVHPDDRAAITEAINNSLNGYGEDNVDCRIVLPDGSIRWINEVWKTFVNEEGKVYAMAGACFDITERKKNEIELKRKEQLLIQQSKLASMGEMIGSIAHQWRQPLNALSIILTDLKDAYVYGELNNDYLTNAVRQSQYYLQFMSKTIDDFRNFFKPSKDKELFNIRESIDDVVNLFSKELENHNIALYVNDNNKEGAYVYSFRSEFKQALLNIINNAKDAIMETVKSQSKGRITIKLDSDDLWSVVCICDNGGGIDLDIINRIFEPYFTTKHDNKGTGIGLYMSKVIIENNMGGKLFVENDDNGACFTILVRKNGYNA